MTHRKLVFSMPAEAHVEGDAECPFVGAVSSNAGTGFFRALSMMTEFVAFDRPRLAAATMQGRSFPFARWAASMRHVAEANGCSTLVYTYTLETWPAVARWFMEPVVDRVFLRATRGRFRRLANYLALHAEDVARWQREREALVP